MLKMGTKWEVSVLEWVEDARDGRHLKYVFKWGGEQLLMAILVMLREKRAGSKRAGTVCIKLDWR